MGERVPFRQKIDELEEQAMKQCMERTMEQRPKRIQGLEKER